MGYLNNSGLSYLFGKLKTIFAPINHGHGGATQSAAGFMSAADKKKLDEIAEGANKYTLPTATSSVLGGVKTGANITNSSGVLSVTKANVTGALGYEPPTENTWRDVVDNLTSTATDKSLSANQGKILNERKVTIRSWDAKVQCATWCRLCYVTRAIDITGSAFILNVAGTRDNVVYDDTFVVKAHYSSKAKITKISGCEHSSIKLRVISNSDGNCYVELYDDAANATNATAQTVHCRLISIYTGSVTWYTAITDGTTLPSDFSVSDSMTTNQNDLQGSLSWSNITDRPWTFAPSSHNHKVADITDFPTLGTASGKNIRTLVNVGTSGWQSTAIDQQYVPDMSLISNWNGAYSGTSSNLAYCNKGAFGTIVTKNVSDYALAGHTHTWDSITDKPSTFTPSSHTHGVIKSLSVSGTTITCTKDDGTTSTITTQDTNTTYNIFKGATTSEAGSTGLVTAPAAGNANRYLRSDGTWAVPPDTNTTYGVFSAATADAAGGIGLVPAPNKGQQTYYLRADGTWAVPTNTWRGIQDSLTSTSATDSLSANQGKVLKDLIDGKAASNHTHNYAGSSSAGGAATIANKLTHSLLISMNGTNQFDWNASEDKFIDITAASVGATSVTIRRW